MNPSISHVHKVFDTSHQEVCYHFATHEFVRLQVQFLDRRSVSKNASKSFFVCLYCFILFSTSPIKQVQQLDYLNTASEVTDFSSIIAVTARRFGALPHVHFSKYLKLIISTGTCGIKVMAWMSDYTQTFKVQVITYPCPDFNAGFAKRLLVKRFKIPWLRIMLITRNMPSDRFTMFV